MSFVESWFRRLTRRSDSSEKGLSADQKKNLFSRPPLESVVLVNPIIVSEVISDDDFEGELESEAYACLRMIMVDWKRQGHMLEGRVQNRHNVDVTILSNVGMVGNRLIMSGVAVEDEIVKAINFLYKKQMCDVGANEPGGLQGKYLNVFDLIMNKAAGLDFDTNKIMEKTVWGMMVNEKLSKNGNLGDIV